MENQTQPDTPIAEHPATVLTAGLTRMRSLLFPNESEAEFDVLAAGWLKDYAQFRSEPFDHQLLKAIESDWLQQRAMLSLLRAEHLLAWAERDREPADRLEEIAAFIRRMQRRHRVYQQIFNGAFKLVEAYRKSRLAEYWANARLERGRQADRSNRLNLRLLLASFHKTEEGGFVPQN